VFTKPMTASMSYLWDPSRILLSRRVAQLSAAEECWYRRALDFAWIDEGLSADSKDAAHRIGKGCTPKAAQKILDTFFVSDKSGKMVNEKQEELRKKLKKKLRNLSENGKRSGQKRRQKRDLATEQMPNNCSTDDEQMSSNVIKGNVTKDKEKKEESTPPASRTRTAKPKDPRTEHPAIKAVLEITTRWPLKDLWDRIIREVGDIPDVEFMRSCYERWRGVNGNPQNLERWLFEPYKTRELPKLLGDGNGINRANNQGQRLTNVDRMHEYDGLADKYPTAEELDSIA
jgi:uncharacterized protein YdaU (DUF1376 family)